MYPRRLGDGHLEGAHPVIPAAILLIVLVFMNFMIAYYVVDQLKVVRKLTPAMEDLDARVHKLEANRNV